MAGTLLGSTRSGDTGKPTIVFLHGFLGESGDWTEVTGRLAQDFDLLAIDLPGHGASTGVPTDLYAVEKCCDAILGTINHHHIHIYTLVGYSMGGRIALQFAIRFSKSVRSLVMISASPGIESESARLSRLASDEMLAERLRSMPPEQFVDNWYRQPLFASLRKSPKYADIAAMRSKRDREALSLALIGFSIGRQHSLWGELTKLTMPVCYVAGELDTKYAAIGQRMADLCPQGKLHIIPHAGHAVHIEQPAELSRVIASFVPSHA